MKPTASQRLPERARLAAAVERHDAAKAVLDRVEQAIEKIKSDRIGDYTSIASARDALAVARSGRSEILISKALGEPAPDLPDIASAQATLDAAEASLDASTSALRVLDGEQRQAKFSSDLAKSALDDAIKTAVAADPALAALRAEFEATRRRMSVLIGALLGAGITVSRVAWEESAFLPASDWVSALAALRDDPDAPLPDPPSDGPDHAHRDGDGKRAAA